MTHEHTEPRYKDHNTPRGGLKLRAMFSTDQMGRSTMQLVCPELRELDAESAEGFLDTSRDEVRRIMRQNNLDCQILPPKEGYKKDRLVIAGPAEDLQIIQTAIYRTQHMSDGNETSEHMGHHTQRHGGRRPTAYSLVSGLFSEKATTALLNTLRRSGKAEFTIVMQVAGTQDFIAEGRNIGGRANQVFETMDREAFGDGHNFSREMTNEMKARGIIQLRGSVEELTWAVNKFGEACGTDIDDLQRNAAGIVERNRRKGRAD